MIDVDRPPPLARGWPRERIVGHVADGLVDRWSASASSPIWCSAWNPELFAKYAPAYLSGLGVTLSLVVISIVLGAILSVPIAYARMSRNRVLSGLAYGYVYFFRGTPLLAQTFLIYYGAGLVPAAARGDRPVVRSSAKPGTARSSPSR